MKHPAFSLSIALAIIHAVFVNAATGADEITEPVVTEPSGTLPYLSPEETLDTFHLPDGYHLEVVLSEPEIAEPVAAAFDGNGRLYVVEMRTYMQDADATGEQEPTSRVSLHEDTDGDGKMDKHSVFADKLLLPRMVMPLDDRVLIIGGSDHYFPFFGDNPTSISCEVFVPPDAGP